jgi:hypothetical protein
MRVLALGILLTAVPAFGQATRIYATELGRRVLARTDQLVEAEVAYIHPPFRGVSTARLRVTARLHGFDREKEILLLFIEDYQAPDAFSATLESSTLSYEHRRKAGLGKYLKDISQLKVPRAEDELTGSRKVKKSVDEAEVQKPKRGVGVRLAKGEQGIFFLRRKGASYEMVGYVPNRDPLYKVKRQRLENILRIETVPALDVRARNAKRFFLAALRSRNPWERGNAARELRVLADRFPKIFVARETREMVARLYGEEEPAIQASLERAVRALDADLALESGPARRRPGAGGEPVRAGGDTDPYRLPVRPGGDRPRARGPGPRRARRSLLARAAEKGVGKGTEPPRGHGDDLRVRRQGGPVGGAAAGDAAP